MKYWADDSGIVRQRSLRRKFAVAYLCGLVTLPAVYVLTYLLLRVSGIFYPFWNHGSWDSIDGTTHIFVIDVLYLPAQVIEIRLANRYHFLTEPSI